VSAALIRFRDLRLRFADNRPLLPGKLKERLLERAAPEPGFSEVRIVDGRPTRQGNVPAPTLFDTGV
jgi:hypothetical protein